MKTLKGRYIPHNPHKYRGDPTNIQYRSSWELKYFKWCDYTDIVLQWSSEEHVISYRSPIDGKMHRYFPDVYLKIKTNKGIEEWIVEIKPSAQTKEPRIQKRMTRKYINEVKTYAVNRYKWDAAIEWCKDRKYKFIILTERELSIK
jgi:hypothetical protein